MTNPAVSANTLSFLRYGALTSGVFYGFLRDQKLTRLHNIEQAHHKAIADATNKGEEVWAEHVAKEMGVTTDTDSPLFDLEKLLDYAGNLA